jgi:trk system potassium uptake protein TrkH
MILFGINFNAYYFILFKKWKQALKIDEVRWYLIIIAGAIVLIMLNAYDTALKFMDNLRNTSFQVASIITTTGFATVDFDLWPQASKTILVILMFIGACAGSTGGGIKVSRIVAIFKIIKNELYFYIHPKSVRKIMMDGKFIDDSMERSICAYFITIIIVFVTSVLAVSYDNFDFTTNFTAVAATLNNIGPGLNLVGPTRNFSIYSNFSKYVLMFDMLAGRLELYPMILLFHPRIWKEIIPHKRKNLESQSIKQNRI